MKKCNNEYRDNTWTLQMSDMNKLLIGINIKKIEVYYDKNYQLLGARAFYKEKSSLISKTGEDWTDTNYNKGFFMIPQNKQNIKVQKENEGLTGKTGEVYRIVLNKNEYQQWEKNKPWWIFYKNYLLECNTIAEIER